MNVPNYIRFSLITLIFNIGDVLSRAYYLKFKQSKSNLIHLLNLIKIGFIPLHFLMINDYILFSFCLVKITLIFLFSFLNGFLCVSYFEMVTQGL